MQNPKRGKQLLRFDGFGFDHKMLETVGATDIDALVDVRDRILIIFEVKLDGKIVPKGQRYVMQRLVEDAKKQENMPLLLLLTILCMTLMKTSIWQT